MSKYMPSKKQGNIPLLSEGAHGDVNGTATATCFCGTVQLEFSTDPAHLVGSFLCNCSDCHKFTASVFASNFTLRDEHIKFVRGEDKLTKYAQSKTIGSDKEMANYFCSVCGTLLYRIGEGFPGMKIMRIGTVDDFSLQDGLLRPQVEQFMSTKNSWLKNKEEQTWTTAERMGI